MATYRGISSEGMDLIAKALLEVSELDQEGYDKLYFYSEEDLPTRYYISVQGTATEITEEQARDLIINQHYEAINVDILPTSLENDKVYVIQTDVSFRQALLMTEPIPQGGA